MLLSTVEHLDVTYLEALSRTPKNTSPNPMGAFTDRLAVGIVNPTKVNPEIANTEEPVTIKTNEGSAVLVRKKDGWYHDYTGVILN
jgi:hypothetical protein